tara:strand:+ start:119 stop:811 length:693 start_codon:yes stop_codon:yes gene_type:complete
MNSTVWYNDPRILLRNDKIKEVWPTKNMSPEEKLNAITRLVIFLVILGFILTFKFTILLIGLVTLALVHVLYFMQFKGNKEKFSNKLPGVYPILSNPEIYEATKDNFVQPTESNPLMNVNLPQILYDKHRKPAAPSFIPEVEEKINESVKEFVVKPFDDKNIEKKLFANLGDDLLFNRSMLQYNSMPNTQIPNDRKSYENYLYGNMLSGKEGNPLALERKYGGAYNYTNP